jgi:hypothetical protein
MRAIGGGRTLWPIRFHGSSVAATRRLVSVHSWDFVVSGPSCCTMPRTDEPVRHRAGANDPTGAAGLGQYNLTEALLSRQY